MATLLTPSIRIPIDWTKNWATQMAGAEEALEAMRLIRFPVADGYALYEVKSVTPPVLQHVDYLDGYRIPDAHIRGLTSRDIQQMLDADALLKQLFPGE